MKKDLQTAEAIAKSVENLVQETNNEVRFIESD